jgi:hypothetical protein
MVPSGQTSKEYFNTLTIIHAGLLVAQVVFGAIAYFLKSNGMFESNGEETSSILILVGPLVAIGGIAASIMAGKGQMKIAKQKIDLKEKLASYRTALLIKLALLEMPTLFVIVCFLLSGKYFLLGFAGAILILFYIYRPTLDGIATDLELSPSDKKTIEDPNAIVG